MTTCAVCASRAVKSFRLSTARRRYVLPLTWGCAVSMRANKRPWTHGTQLQRGAPWGLSLLLMLAPTTEDGKTVTDADGHKTTVPPDKTKQPTKGKKGAQ